MTLSFDKFERYELPQVTLCNPNSRATEVDGKITITDTVGVLSNPKGMNLKLNFNAPHELSFDYYRHKSSDPIKQSFYDNIYEAIQTDRYIFLTDIGYFTIKNSNDSDEDNIDRKSISLKSCEENELATAEGLHLKEGTYYLHTEDNTGLLDLFLPKTAGWTMGYIDPSLFTKPYFVEDTEVNNGYNFLYTTIQDMFECIVEPDIIKRTISVYSRTYYAEHHLTDIHIAKYNLLKHKTVEENDEDKYTALNVQGKDENLEIRAVNPTGKNVIYNFEPRYSWMSPALQDAVERWQGKCESVEEEYLRLQQGYYNDMQNIVFPLEEDIKVLELQLKEKELTRDTIVYGDYDKEEYDEIQEEALKQVNAEIQNISKQASDKKAQLEIEKNKIDTNYSQLLSQINKDCALDTTAVDIDGNTIFTVELLNELMTHIKPTDYVDEYMLVTESMTYPQRFEKAKELMDRAQSQLVKISSGQKTYSIDTRSFLFNKQFKHFSEQLCAGAIIYVETKSDTMEQLHLTGIDINFDEKSTNFTLGNKYDRSDLKALYDEALGQNSKSFSELKYIAGILEEQRKQLDYQRNWVAELRTLTLDNVLTSEDQAIEINNRGLIGRKRQLNEDGSWKTDENDNPLFELEQVKLINNTLVFTDDNWNTASTAVGKIAVGYNADGSVKYSYGINGQVLIGELILGNNLVLTGTGAGIKVKDSSGNDAFYADDEGNLVLSGTIFAKSGNIAGWIIDGSNLFYQSDSVGTGLYGSLDRDGIAISAGSNQSNVGSAPFRVYHDGRLFSTSGIIGGWNITSQGLTANNVGLWTTKDHQNIAIFAGVGSAGMANAPFRVYHDGSLVATNATIIGNITAESGTFNGTINATSGNINGWTIGNGGLYFNNDITGCGLLGTTVHANIAIYAGANSSGIGGAPFRVYHDGSLVATSATITGIVNAESGTIGKWKINNGSLYASGISSSHTGAAIWLEIGGLTYQDSGMVTPLAASWRNVLLSVTSSDIRIKNNVNDIENQYEKFFDLLQPKTYNYTPEAKCGNTEILHFGFVAQDILMAQHTIGVNDLALVFEDDYYSLRIQEFIALNTWQIQKAKTRITELENTVAELKTQIQTLTAG